ncbi:hypothetical protein HPB50_028878 [Hyalomma asiaticum]|nr:hypothetical protein HPB50_028878 [Hyalomma asiaticum]
MRGSFTCSDCASPLVFLAAVFFFPVEVAPPEPLIVSAHVARFTVWDRDRDLDLDALVFPGFLEPARRLERERPLELERAGMKEPSGDKSYQHPSVIANWCDDMKKWPQLRTIDNDTTKKAIPSLPQLLGDDADVENFYRNCPFKEIVNAPAVHLEGRASARVACRSAGDAATWVFPRSNAGVFTERGVSHSVFRDSESHKMVKVAPTEKSPPSADS